MKKIHDFDEPVDRIGTDSYKWDCEGAGGKYIPLGVADTDFRAPEEVCAAVRKRVDFGVFAYGNLPQKRFADAVCGWYKKRYGLTLDPQVVRHSQGLMTGALWMILNAYTRPGDKILVQPPVYNTFGIVIRGAGRFVENNDLILKDGRYEIDFDDLEKKTADPRVRILLVCNPANPVGRVWTREELTRMYEICKKNHTLIVSDEIHGDIVYAPHRHIPYFSLSEEIADNVIVMGSPSISRAFTQPMWSFITRNCANSTALFTRIIILITTISASRHSSRLTTTASTMPTSKTSICTKILSS